MSPLRDTIKEKYGLGPCGDPMTSNLYSQAETAALSIPLPDASVDAIISNRVINLSTDQDRVLREAFRVVRPGGRFAVSDVVVRGVVPESIRRDVELWIGCVAGALEESSYRDKLVSAGFESVDIEPWRAYDVGEIGIDTIAVPKDAFASAFIRASKPAAPR